MLKRNKEDKLQHVHEEDYEQEEEHKMDYDEQDSEEEVQSTHSEFIGPGPSSSHRSIPRKLDAHIHSLL